MEDMHRMMAEIREQQRQERELRESYDEQWDYSGTGKPGKIDQNNETNKITLRSVQSDKRLVCARPIVLVWPLRQTRGIESRGKNYNNTNTNIKTHLTQSYPGNTTTQIATARGGPDERKGERPRKPGQEKSGQTEPRGILGILTGANQETGINPHHRNFNFNFDNLTCMPKGGEIKLTIEYTKS